MCFVLGERVFIHPSVHPSTHPSTNNPTIQQSDPINHHEKSSDSTHLAGDEHVGAGGVEGGVVDGVGVRNGPHLLLGLARVPQPHLFFGLVGWFVGGWALRHERGEGCWVLT